jgi:hypothetical protein
MKLSSFLVAPWRTSADDVFRTKITVVIVRQEVKPYSLVIYTCMKGWRGGGDVYSMKIVNID